MKFKDLEELKNFIIWAKEQGLKEVEVGEVKVVVSDLEIHRVVAAQYESQNPQAQANEEPISQEAQELEEKLQTQAEIDEERKILFHSSGI